MESETIPQNFIGKTIKSFETKFLLWKISLWIAFIKAFRTTTIFEDFPLNPRGSYTTNTLKILKKSFKKYALNFFKTVKM